MPKVWGLAVLVVGLAFAASAHADTVYLRDGQSFWGTEILEEGNTVIVVRPGSDLKFPRADVLRIERLRSTLPPFYAAPEPPPAAGQAGAPGAAPGAPAGGPEAPPVPGGTPPPPPPPGAPPPPPPPGSGPIQLPPPPPPPAPNPGAS